MVVGFSRIAADVIVGVIGFRQADVRCLVACACRVQSYVYSGRNGRDVRVRDRLPSWVCTWPAE